MEMGTKMEEMRGTMRISTCSRGMNKLSMSVRVGLGSDGGQIHRGTPSSVVGQAAALEELLLKVKGDAQHGVFKNE